MASPNRSAERDDVAAARDVGERVALALDSSRLYEQQRRLAEGLQRSMLTAPPEPDHAEIVVRYRPAMVAAQAMNVLVGGAVYGEVRAAWRARKRLGHPGPGAG